jgi:hypothetical protein
MSEKSLAKKNKNTELSNSVNYQVNTLNNVFDVAKSLTELNLLPKVRTLLTLAQVATAIELGRTVGLSPIVSINNIDFIEGSPSWKSKIIPGLLSQAKIAIKVIKDYEPEYVEKNVPINGPDGKPLVDDNGVVKFYKDQDGNYVKNKTEIDRITTVEFLRNIDGIGLVRNEISYRLSDAKAADLYPKKDNWLRLTRQMMMARCISRGARLFASDVVAGLYENTELAELYDDYSIDAQGEDEIIVTKKVSNSKEQDLPGKGGKTISVEMKKEWFPNDEPSDN